MKRLTLAIVTLVVFVFAAAPCFAANAKLTAKINAMQKLVQQPLDKWQMSSKLTQEEVMDPKTPSNKFRRVGIGYFWADAQDIWLRTKYEVPETILNVPVAGSSISLAANIEDWGEIFINGELVQSFRRSTGYVTFTESAKPGDRYFIVIHARRKDRDTGLLRDISLSYSTLREVDDIVDGFVESAQAMDVLIEVSGEDAAKWQPTIDQAADAIDIAALEKGDLKTFYASLDTFNQIMAPLSATIKQYSMLLVAYSHIDLAWLWDKHEGEHVVWKGTSEQVLDLLKDYPDMIYVANQMHGYRWMETDYPELFARIKESVAAGKWSPSGAEWVEPDGNLPHGESYVRQFMYGRKYSKDKFGFVSTVGLTPDSFGYNWSMPQILVKSDMRGFVTQKISWNDTTRFPYNLFWWESPDGSKILVYFPQGSYGENVNGLHMANQLASMKRKHGVNQNLVIYGVGDHGGGIPRDYIQRAYALRTNPLYPNIEFMNFDQVFDRVEAEAKTKDFPTWKTELYLEYHRGTYTTQADTKNNNRRSEHCLMNAEKFSTLAETSAGVAYPFSKIEEAWKILLFNQFHDILPGSSITPVYIDADKDYKWIAGECKTTLDGAFAGLDRDADTTGGGTPYMLFNGLSWARDDVVEIEVDDGVTQAAVYDDAGREIPAQVTKLGEGTNVIFVARGVPALGYAVYHVDTTKKSSAKGGLLKVDNGTMENDFYKVVVDPKTGWISSIFDKKNNREILANGGAAFELQAQHEDGTAADAWDPRFPADGGHIVMPLAEKVAIVENGPVRVTIAAERSFETASGFRSYYSLVDGSPIIHGRLDARWKDPNIFLKSAFTFNLDADYVTYEIPYANIQRVTKPDEPAEKAQWEVSGHRWADYTDNKGDYGVTLLSFSKYGYDARNNVLRMTMLRSPMRPDAFADRGNHSIPYALYPHAGGWAVADSPLRGMEYNDPVFAVKVDAHAGAKGKRFSYASAASDNVAISTIKKAEDGNGYVIRLVETEGRDGTVTIKLPAIPKLVEETNLVERKLGDIAAPGKAELTVPIGHYEIKSIRVVF